MNLLILNTFDAKGGAAIATYRLHRGLRSIGVNSRFLVKKKITDDASVVGVAASDWQKLLAIFWTYFDAILVKLYRNRGKTLFSSAWMPERIASRILSFKPDIIHLSWVVGGFLRIETLKSIKKPIVWTLHDMWPFTGGCHYDEECGKFRQACGNCPVLNSGREGDLSRRVWARKQKAWKNIPLVVVAPSRWLAEMARASSLFCGKRVEVIPNGIDTEIHKPADKGNARAIYNLPQDKHLVMFSALGATSDKRKGQQFLVPALKRMADEGWGDNTELIIVGASCPDDPPDFGMKVHYVGRLEDEISQVLLYSAADVVVAPSMQENLANTVVESLACGTPVVAFDIGGMPDMIDHHENGYLAKPFETEDLFNGIVWVIEDAGRHELLSQCARETVVERYALGVVAERYNELYQDILK